MGSNSYISAKQHEKLHIRVAASANMEELTNYWPLLTIRDELQKLNQNY
jgi:hypothetical protein